MTKVFIVLLLFLLWGAFSWRWYTCGVKGFCNDTTIAEINTTKTTSESGVRTCEPYLRGYVAYGEKNNPAHVRRIEQFLNRVEGESLPEDGIYDIHDSAAIKRFQEKYRSDILTPWNLPHPTGQVYKTTRNHINTLFCAYKNNTARNNK